MLPVIALVGRPNVGKSTLFNVLTGTRDALVADLPGLTRDRQYGFGRRGGHYIVVDTGGLVESPAGVEALMAAQTERAVAEADCVVLLVDARAGPTPADRYVAERLRRLGKTVLVAANKCEGLDPDVAALEFHALGLGAPLPISAAHGEGIEALTAGMLAGLATGAPAADQRPGEAIRIAVVGRPNVGKSTLINRLIGEERLVAFDEPGTTRDSVHVPFERDGRRYVLIDTAGIRRRARVEGAVEKFSVVKALQAIDEAHVVIGVLDAHETVAEQDATLLGHVAERGRALLLAVNKWDHIPPEQRDHVRNQLALKMPFLDFAPRHFISALHGSGVGDLLGAAPLQP
jgi:GTPase